MFAPRCLSRAAMAFAPVSAALLVMAEGEIDRLLRPVAAREQSLGRFEDRHQRALVVDRAAPDDEAVGDRLR